MPPRRAYFRKPRLSALNADLERCDSNDGDGRPGWNQGRGQCSDGGGRSHRSDRACLPRSALCGGQLERRIFIKAEIHAADCRNLCVDAGTTTVGAAATDCTRAQVWARRESLLNLGARGMLSAQRMVVRLPQSFRFLATLRRIRSRRTRQFWKVAFTGMVIICFQLRPRPGYSKSRRGTLARNHTDISLEVAIR
jgi:hypothetical protein